MDIVNELTGEHLAYWADQARAEPIVMKAPSGLDGCTDCAAVDTTNEHGERVIRCAWKPNKVEVAHLVRGGTIWLSTWGGLPPHMLEVQAPPGPEITVHFSPAPDLNDTRAEGYAAGLRDGRAGR